MPGHKVNNNDYLGTLLHYILMRVLCMYNNDVSRLGGGGDMDEMKRRIIIIKSRPFKCGGNGKCVFSCKRIWGCGGGLMIINSIFFFYVYYKWFFFIYFSRSLYVLTAIIYLLAIIILLCKFRDGIFWGSSCFFF